MTALQADKLSKSFGNAQALRELILSVESGSFFGLLGPNGAGKSTFMSIVSGFLRQDSGSISLFGQTLEPNDLGPKRLIGFAPQEVALYKEMSAEANLRFFGKLAGLSGKRLRERVRFALEVAQLTERRHSPTKEYSGGMKRRLNIAVALLHEPKILLCDEPTVGVDPQSRNAIFDTLQQLRESGMTIVYSTHYMEEAERLCDTIAIIEKGQILRIGDLNTLLSELPAIDAVTANAELLEGPLRGEFARFGALSGNGRLVHLAPAPGFRLSEMYRWIEDNRLDARAFAVKRASLENLFLHLTGKELRE